MSPCCAIDCITINEKTYLGSEMPVNKTCIPMTMRHSSYVILSVPKIYMLMTTNRMLLVLCTLLTASFVIIVCPVPRWNNIPSDGSNNDTDHDSYEGIAHVQAFFQCIRQQSNYRYVEAQYRKTFWDIIRLEIGAAFSKHGRAMTQNILMIGVKGSVTRQKTVSLETHTNCAY